MRTRDCFASIIWILLASASWAQPSSFNSSVPATQSSSLDGGRTVRDPVTGKLYFQQWVTESVPITRWENKQLTTTVYETQWVNQVDSTPQTVFRPQTQYVLQPYWKGAWNPFAQPTLAYQSKPVTTWMPTAVPTNQVIAKPVVVPRQQTITVPQPITETRTQQRLVQTEVPQSPAQISQAAQASRVPAGLAYTAQQPRALINFPILARQPFPPPVPNQASYPSYNFSPAQYSGNALASASPSTMQNGVSSFSGPSTSGWTSTISPPRAGQSAIASTNQPYQYSNSASVLRPVTQAMQSVFPPNYNAPMRTATGQGGSWNAMQAGMTPTVLR